MKTLPMKAASYLAGLLAPTTAFGAETSRDTLGPLITFLETWEPFLFFLGVWIFFMRRNRLSQPWDRITHRLEGIETQLTRIANILDKRRSDW